MFVYETMVPTDREAQRFTTAFYRFLELNQPPTDATAMITTDRGPGWEKRRVELWSDEAVRSFERYFSTFQVPGPCGLPRRIRRFDDLL